MKYLIVVDMQNDFITGSLGTKEAEAILPEVIAKVKNYDGKVIFTKDTHTPEYLSTQEGRNLPVEHCISGEEGWYLDKALENPAAGGFTISPPLAVWSLPQICRRKMKRRLSKK